MKMARVTWKKWKVPAGLLELRPRNDEDEQRLLVGAILAIEPRLLNGAVDRMARELCAMLVVFVCSLLSSLD